MPTVDLVDETFIVASPPQLAAVVADRAQWARWWPDLQLSVFMDRGEAGIRWSIQGALVGSAEIWLEPFGDGVILHYYLRAEPTEPGSATRAQPAPTDAAGWRRAARLRQARARSWKRHAWALKDLLEGGREPGQPAHTATVSPPPAAPPESQAPPQATPQAPPAAG